MLILGIETSCDETAAAVLRNGREILSNVISSQVDSHRAYGGIVPEIASRQHVEAIGFIVEQALAEAGTTFAQIDAVAVTTEPGLVGSLLVGKTYGYALALALGKPVIEVNHLEGHMYSPFLIPKSTQNGAVKAIDDVFPFISLLVSGGHTMIIEVKDHGEYRMMGSTRDDAAGEAFDKVARYVGLGYPGGPIVDKMAKQGKDTAIELPRALLNDGFDFSFSGLKTAVITYIKKNGLPLPLPKELIPDFCASFQKAIIDVLVDKTVKAAQEVGVNTIALAGGVSANSRLREELKKRGSALGIDVLYPPLSLCTDNAAMIAAVGNAKLTRAAPGGTINRTIFTRPNRSFILTK